MEQTIKLSIHNLKIHPKNTEFFDDIDGDTYKQFKKSIQDDGIITPLIISPDMTIISGHQRYLACKDLGINLVPVIIREELIDEDLKLRHLIASNFGRLSNNPAKYRAAVAVYYELNINSHGGDRKSKVQDAPMKLNQEQIAKELGISTDELKRIMSIEQKLIPELRQALDKGFISKTAALGICSKLDKKDQEELLTELTKQIGIKVENSIGKEKVSISNSEIDKLSQDIKQLKEQNQKLAEANTNLLKLQVEKSELEQKLNQLNNELINRPTVSVEVKPEDYDKTKEDLENYKKDQRKLKEEYDKRVEKIAELQDKIKAITEISEEEKYLKKLKDGAIFFCGRVNDFIEKTGGFVWLSENINQLPEYERKSYIKAIEMVENWAMAMKANIK